MPCKKQIKCNDINDLIGNKIKMIGNMLAIPLRIFISIILKKNCGKQSHYVNDGEKPHLNFHSILLCSKVFDEIKNQTNKHILLHCLPCIFL